MTTTPAAVDPRASSAVRAVRALSGWSLVLFGLGSVWTRWGCAAAQLTTCEDILPSVGIVLLGCLAASAGGVVVTLVFWRWLPVRWRASGLAAPMLMIAVLSLH